MGMIHSCRKVGSNVIEVFRNFYIFELIAIIVVQSHCLRTTNMNFRIDNSHSLTWILNSMYIDYGILPRFSLQNCIVTVKILSHSIFG